MPVTGKESVANSHSPIWPRNRKVPGPCCFYRAATGRQIATGAVSETAVGRGTGPPQPRHDAGRLRRRCGTGPPPESAGPEPGPQASRGAHARRAFAMTSQCPTPPAGPGRNPAPARGGPLASGKP